LDRRGSTIPHNVRSAGWGRGSGLRKEGFDGRPVDKVEKLIDIATAVGQEVGVVGVFVHVEAEDGSHTPDGITVLRVSDIVEEFFRAVIVSCPSPTAGGNPGGFQVLLEVVEGSEVLIDMLQDTIGGFAVPAEDGEVEFVVFEATDGEREIDLEGSNAGVDLVCDGGIGGIRSAHFFELGKDPVALVDVACVELEMFLVGFI